MKSKSGFTIVELLIVIVVIAILAAITIVAYNGIQERARVSSVSSALSQANKKLAAYQVENSGQYPADLAAVGVASGESVTYQYSVNNSTNPATYCVTATTGPTSYKASSTTATPTSGGCAGHGQGGAAPLTNYAINPSFEVDASGWNLLNCSSSSRDATTAQSGSSSYKCVSNSTSVFYFNGPSAAVNAGETWSMSAYVKSDQARQIEIYISALNSTAGEVQRINSTYTTLAANTWTRVLASGVIPSGAVNARIQLNFRSPLVGQTGWVDSVFYSNSSQMPNYADGATVNWVWNGTANNATSTGPPV